MEMNGNQILISTTKRTHNPFNSDVEQKFIRMKFVQFSQYGLLP